MNWAYPSLLYGLWAVPFVLVILLLKSRADRRKFMAAGQYSIEWQVRSFLRDLAVLACCIFMILTLAEPRRGREPVSGERSGLDVAVAFDVSRSMLAQDLNPSRLNRSVAVLRQIIRLLDGARFSLIPFTGGAQVVVPMTGDQAVLDLWIGRLGPGMSTIPGTNAEAALRAAKDSFPGGEGRTRAVILITDGETLEGRIDRVSRELVQDGIPVFTLAAGTAEGSTIPLADGSYVKDTNGQPVVSRMETQEIERLARETNGTFYSLDNPGAGAGLANDIIAGRDFAERRGIRFAGVNRFRIFLIPVLLLMLFHLAVRIVPWRRK